MPLTRYLIRNEFGLAKPGLYKAAERDDSEALLQGVAIAGLVGVLRQLGDLAEFAAEIFHDLHEEVMATASRGHGLMARVQQLESDFPSTEKALLSQTSHSSFFSAPGIDWHPSLGPKQNLVTRGDLPRFVMGSYEECRGPPRLFLLDKFDVAGAGACIKRYTDPSFFKVEARSSGLATDVQREKKTHKGKKKRARMRNGESPKIAPTSHAKLHQLLQEERFENGLRDPARVVKLKKRQLNLYPFDLEIGKSYMDKFVETDNTSEAAIEELIEPSINELKEEIIDRGSETAPELFQVPNGMCTKKVKIPHTRETCCGLAKLVETWCDYTQIGTMSDETGASMSDSTVCSSIALQNGHVVDELCNGDADVISDAPLHYCGHEMLQVTHVDKYCTDIEETGSARSVSTTEEPLSVLQEIQVAVSLPEFSSLPNVQQLDDEAGRPYSEEKTDISKAVADQEKGGYICNVDGAVGEAIPLELPICNHLNYEDDEDEVNNDMIMERVEAEDVAIELTDSSHPIFRANHSQSDSGIPIFPEETKGHEEMPPLPPMQWRMGKPRSCPLDSMRESVQCSQDSHTPALSSAADEKVQFGFSAPDLQPQNPCLPHAQVEDEELQPPNMVDELARGDTQPLNPSTTLPTISSDGDKHAIQASGRELIESTSNPSLPEPAVDDANCSHDPISSKGSLMEPPNQLAPVIAEDVDMLQNIPEDLQRQGDKSLPPSQNIENEEPQTGLSTSGGEIACYSKTSVLISLFEAPNLDEHSTMRLHRPRSPLVAAHDKTMLRKVSGRVRAGIEPKVEERDTLLEQIRAKSFKLKPAVVTRPNIEGPKTNLKVVAIVEKANAIRQALAGSDEDDDSDSWSDS